MPRVVVVNGQTGNDRAAWRVDIQVDWFRRVFAVQIKHDTNDLVGKFIVNLAAKKNDAFTVQAIVNVDPE